MGRLSNLVTIILISLLWYNVSISQDESNIETKERIIEVATTNYSCEKGNHEAEIDFKNEDLGLYFYGNNSLKFKTWVRLMQEAYDLKIKGGGGFSSIEGDCYNEVMREYIKEKFGINAFEKITSKLDSLYENDLGDRIAEYKGGQKELLKYIYCNIPDEMLFENKKEAPTLLFQISISKDGHVINKGIVRAYKFHIDNERYKIVANEIINKMPDWNPAIENEKRVVFDLYYIPIKFAKESKEKICD